MAKALRINFELDRADNPPLYDELMQFAKGVKRVSRLRTLAYAGLLSQGPRDISWPTQAPAPSIEEARPDPATVVASMELFGPSLDVY